MSFSCAGAFVHQAQKTDNTIQGDRFEGIFARLEQDDERVALMQTKLGNDLNIIPDGDYVLLKRKSAMLKPIFCLYGYKAIDALNEAGANIHPGMNRICHRFDPKMYSGFSGDWKSTVIADDRRFTILIMEPKPFVDHVKNALFSNRISYRMGIVDYSMRNSNTFFIEPTPSYDELYCKDPMYSYQFEVRICLYSMKFISIFDRFSLDIGAFSDKEFKIDHMPLIMYTNAKIGDRNKLSPDELAKLAK